MITESMSMGTKFINSIGLTILGMGVVFLVLIVLSFSLDLLRVLAGDDKKKDTPSQEVAKSSNAVATPSEANKQEDDQELVAVIAAAIAAMSGTSVDDFVVRSIRPLPQKQSIWGAAGRQQQMLERL